MAQRLLGANLGHRHVGRELEVGVSEAFQALENSREHVVHRRGGDVGLGLEEVDDGGGVE